MQAGGGHVVDVQEFAAWGAAAPDGDGWGGVECGLMELADQGGQDVAVGQVEVVAGAVEVGRHDAAEVGAVLAVVGFAEFDAGDLGDGVGFVGRFEWAGEEGGLGHRLRGQTRVDAGAAEEQQAFDAVTPGRLNDVGFDQEVLVEEFGRVGVVGVDAADLGRREVDLGRALFGEKGFDGGLVGQVEFGVGAGDEMGVAGAFEGAHQGGADHAAMAGDVNRGR